jgi:hypothetical protein
VFDPVGTDMRGPWGPWCRHCVSTLHSLSAGASNETLARKIGELNNQQGWTPSWTQIPIYAGSCTKSSRLTRRWGPFCAGRFQRLPACDAASATAHCAPVREAGYRQWAVGRLVHLTGFRSGSVVAEVAWPGHRAALTGLTCRGGGRAPWRRGRGWQRQWWSIVPAPLRALYTVVSVTLWIPRSRQPGTPRAPRRACVRIATNLRSSCVDGQPRAHGTVK